MTLGAWVCLLIIIGCGVFAGLMIGIGMWAHALAIIPGTALWVSNLYFHVTRWDK